MPAKGSRTHQTRSRTGIDDALTLLKERCYQSLNYSSLAFPVLVDHVRLLKIACNNSRWKRSYVLGPRCLDAVKDIAKYYHPDRITPSFCIKERTSDLTHRFYIDDMNLNCLFDIHGRVPSCNITWNITLKFPLQPSDNSDIPLKGTIFRTEYEHRSEGPSAGAS